MDANHPLRAWRKKHGLTASQLGERIGVKKSTVSFYETGSRTPRPRVMKRIVEVTDGAVTANDFLLPAEAAE